MPLFGLSSESTIDDILQANREWAKTVNSDIFSSNAVGQKPHTLWIGCSDSRCSEHSLLNLQPGEVFTHRNIANLANHHSDTAPQAVLKFSVSTLKVKKILVVGHTDCGGVNACLRVTDKDNYYNENSGVPRELISWLKPVIDLRFEHQEELDKLKTPAEKNRVLVKYNIKRQIDYLVNCNQNVKAAIHEGSLHVYGLLYNVDSGLLELVDI